MNKEELVQEVAKKASVSQKEAAEVINAWVDTVQKTVAKGKKVTLVGFGTFESRKRAARMGRNPQAAGNPRHGGRQCSGGAGDSAPLGRRWTGSGCRLVLSGRGCSLRSRPGALNAKSSSAWHCCFLRSLIADGKKFRNINI